MKKVLLAVAATTALTSIAAMPAAAVQITGNAGLVSDYVFRGADASNGKAAAQAGADLTAGLFYAGTWASSVEIARNVDVLDNNTGLPVSVKKVENSGIELDLYAGLGSNIGDFTWRAGAIYYGYTDDVIDPFIEANLTGGWKWFSVSVNPGKYLNDTRIGGVKADQQYIFYSATAAAKGFYGTVGYWDWDKVSGIPATSQIQSAGYFQLGYGDTLTVNDVDLFNYSISYVYADSALVANDQSKNTLIFGIKKKFSIFK